MNELKNILKKFQASLDITEKLIAEHAAGMEALKSLQGSLERARNAASFDDGKPEESLQNVLVPFEEAVKLLGSFAQISFRESELCREISSVWAANQIQPATPRLAGYQ